MDSGLGDITKEDLFKIGSRSPKDSTAEKSKTYYIVVTRNVVI